MLKQTIIVIVCLLLSQITFAADNSAQANKKLQKVNQQISRAKKNLSGQRNQKKSLNNQLKKLEISIGHIAKKLDKSQHQLAKKNKKLKTLQAKENADTTKMKKQQQQLEQQIRIAYVLSRQSPLKIILNQQSPSNVSRLLAYNNYLNQARAHYIGTIHQTLTDLKQTKTAIIQQTSKIKALRQQQLSEKKLLKNSLKKRKRVIVALNQKISSQTTQLKQLTDNKKTLTTIINQLAKQKALASSHSFKNQRGKLPWPTKGKIVSRFGTKIDGNRMRSTGVTIRAPIGQDVYAIAPGRVVFADWLKGYGLLMIVAHGDGYMTLYAHNYSLYKAKGDTVKTGDLIARVGKSGGLSKSGLYFEIRQAGRPLNPAKWCS